LTALDLKLTVAKLASVRKCIIQWSVQKDLKMLSRCAAQKPLLTEKIKKKRMSFCKASQHWTSDGRSKVLYSDVTSKCIRSISTKVRRLTGSNHYDSWYMIKTVKHPNSVMIWGCFSGAVGGGGLFFLPKDTYMNAGGVCSTDLRLDTSPNGLKQVYTSPEAI
jgi:hypothetical protein